MKAENNISLPRRKWTGWLIRAAGVVLLGTGGNIAAQTENAAPPVVETELISPSADFTCIQKSDQTIDLKLTLKAKIEGSLRKLHHIKVRYFLVTDSADLELGQAITGMDGIALLGYKPDGSGPDTGGRLHFKAVVAGNKSMEGTAEELSIKRAILTLAPVKEDSLLKVQVKLAETGRNPEIPVAEASISVYVKRMFLPLKVGEGTTDENGESVIEIPGNLPGDAGGNLFLLARLEDSEEYGNLEASGTAEKWGVPVSDQRQEQPRALWSSNPPLWMLITFIILMAVVWGHYVVIVYQLFRLRKEEPPVQAGT